MIRHLDAKPQEPSWEQVGNGIRGEAADDWSGRSVGISDDGKRVVIGAPENDGNGIGSGQVRVFVSSKLFVNLFLHGHPSNFIAK